MSILEKIKNSALILKDKLLEFLKAEHSYITGFLFITILGFLFQLAGWWSLMLLAGGIGGFIMKKSGLLSFLIGFLAIGLVWSCFFIYFMIIGPIFELTALITSILGFLESFPVGLILITLIIGGLLGGLGSLNGSYISTIIYSTDKQSKESVKDLNHKRTLT